MTLDRHHHRPHTPPMPHTTPRDKDLQSLYAAALTTRHAVAQSTLDTDRFAATVRRWSGVALWSAVALTAGYMLSAVVSFLA